jgi:hypothetical protein
MAVWEAVLRAHVRQNDMRGAGAESPRCDDLGSCAGARPTGDFELRFGSVGEYWLTTDDTARFLFRAFGMGAKRATVNFTYTGFGFPASDAEIPTPNR